MVSGYHTSHLGLELGVHTSFNFLVVLLKGVKPVKSNVTSSLVY